MSRITGIKYPSGQEVTYQYNNIGELTGMPGYLKEGSVNIFSHIYKWRPKVAFE
jgi:hypothetical protein